MIAKINRGGRVGGLLTYLVGPGRHNEHSEPHLVGGSSDLMALYGMDELSAATALDIAHRIDMSRRLHGTEVRAAVRNEVGEKTGQMKPAHVWHCVLSVGPEDGVLSDTTWSEIAAGMVQRMGFADPENPCGWVGVHHGPSGNGHDHIHLVVSLVHEDGRPADVHNDYRRAYTATGELEAIHGLTPLATRMNDRVGMPGTRFPEHETAARQGRTEPARLTLERTVRACAEASNDEAEFVRRLRRERVLVYPRYATGSTDVIAGYSVALTPPSGETPVRYGGGTLARDLTLPRLRERWTATPQDASAAYQEWDAALHRQPPANPTGRETMDVDPELWGKQVESLQRLREVLARVPVEDLAGWAHVARQLAGTFAAWSLQVEGDTPGPLATTARELARVGQLRRHQEQPRPTPLARAGGLAYLFAAVANRGQGNLAHVAMWRQLTSLMAAIQDSMQARREHQAVLEYNHRTRLALHAINHHHLEGNHPPLGTTPQPLRTPLPPISHQQVPRVEGFVGLGDDLEG